MSQAYAHTDLAYRTSVPMTIFGYNVIDKIGRGAGSEIYAVSQPGSQQLYALKHVVRHNDRDARFVEQLENEYEVGKHLAHPNLRKVIDYQKHTKLFKVHEAALVLELVDGTPLDVSIPSDLPDLINVFIQTAHALKALHDSGYIHCDFKPANVLVQSDLSVKVIDLGQACALNTVKQRIQGTPDYISPEQVRCKPVSPVTDVFNLGASMYWTLCGRKLPTLFTAGKDKNSFVADTLIQAPHEINHSVPEPLSNLVMECVRTRQEKRPQNMDELIRRLEIMHHVALRDTGRLH